MYSDDDNRAMLCGPENPTSQPLRRPLHLSAFPLFICGCNIRRFEKLVKQIFQEESD
jgi:hypothetical protein